MYLNLVVLAVDKCYLLTMNIKKKKQLSVSTTTVTYSAKRIKQ